MHRTGPTKTTTTTSCWLLWSLVTCSSWKPTRGGLTITRSTSSSSSYSSSFCLDLLVPVGGTPRRRAAVDSFYYYYPYSSYPGRRWRSITSRRVGAIIMTPPSSRRTTTRRSCSSWHSSPSTAAGATTFSMTLLNHENDAVDQGGTSSIRVDASSSSPTRRRRTKQVPPPPPPSASTRRRRISTVTPSEEDEEEKGGAAGFDNDTAASGMVDDHGELGLVQQPKQKKMKKTTTRSSSSTTGSSASNAKPPGGWEDLYSLVEELRRDRAAPCDISGCEALPDPNVSPAEYRFQVLVSLMLSSQTKDAIVGQTIRAMQRDGVLNVPSIAAMSNEQLHQYLRMVGFHNNKTKYIKEVVSILQDQYQGDIPANAAELMSLPGVGPKMAYICENVTWNKQSGIGVDTHMHRIFNQLGWVKSKTPEQTRVQLESWLPRDKWASVNLLWVGFGQEVQQHKTRIVRKALDSSRPADALRLLKTCGVDYHREACKQGWEEDLRKALQGGES